MLGQNEHQIQSTTSIESLFWGRRRWRRGLVVERTNELFLEFVLKPDGATEIRPFIVHSTTLAGIRIRVILVVRYY